MNLQADLGADIFHTTRWSLVLRARIGKSKIASKALNELCGAYWYPLYAYIRRHCTSVEDAEDLTQGYFTSLLDRGYLHQAEATQGRLRAFLLADVKLYLGNERQRSRAAKRGGGRTLLSYDQALAEGRYRVEPVDHVTPEQLFDRAWANTLLTRVQEALREEFAGKGQAEDFESLQQFLAWNAGEETYADVAARLGRTESDIKVTVHRMRKRYRSLLEREVADTVSSLEDIQSELRLLASAFG